MNVCVVLLFVDSSTRINQIMDMVNTVAFICCIIVGVTLIKSSTSHNATPRFAKASDVVRFSVHSDKTQDHMVDVMTTVGSTMKDVRVSCQLNWKSQAICTN